MQHTSEEYERFTLAEVASLSKHTGDVFAQLRIIGMAQIFANLTVAAAMKETVHAQLVKGTGGL